jgi:hypothetical protein
MTEILLIGGVLLSVAVLLIVDHFIKQRIK